MTGLRSNRRCEQGKGGLEDVDTGSEGRSTGHTMVDQMLLKIRQGRVAKSSFQSKLLVDKAET